MEEILACPSEAKKVATGPTAAAGYGGPHFELYREKRLLHRLDVWPVLLLLLLCSVNTVRELWNIAQHQTELQQRQAAAAASRCVKTADPVLLIFHAPHISNIFALEEEPSAAETAQEKGKREAGEEEEEVEPQQQEKTQREEEAKQTRAETGGWSRDAEIVKKEGVRPGADVVKKGDHGGGGEEEETAGEQKKKKERKKKTEEESELFPVLSWLFSSLWFVYTLILLFCGGLLHLTTHWWMRMETALGCSRVFFVGDATHVLVVPSGEVETETLCEIHRLPSQIFFLYRKKKYLFDAQQQRFLPLQFPKDLPLSDYFTWTGLQTAAAPSASLQQASLRKKKARLSTAAAASSAREHARGEGERHRDSGGVAGGWGGAAAAARGELFTAAAGGEGKTDRNRQGQERGRKTSACDAEYLLSPYWRGREGGGSVVSLVEAKYGRNDYDIPIPSFGDLFKEHAVAPFFVFQVFSISLWLLDEYWHYSVMMLVMLVFLECQMVKKRLKDFQQLRSMRMAPVPVSVYRNGAWCRLVSDQLLPGDIFALFGRTGAGEAPLVCPVDALLLQGMAVVNEASLTGESVPQTKVALEREVDDREEGRREEAGRREECRRDGEMEGGEEKKEERSCDRLDMKQRHRQHVVFAGTSVLLHANEQATFRNTRIPEKGCVAFVLRTAFSTSQGKLVRTILFSHGRVTVSSREAWYFLGILLLLAVGASAYVVRASLSDASGGRRISSRFKLFLACSHIVMAVVPAEFPITLSLAVTMSLIFLITKKIFCTEPFRVPYAGQVDICCFDKTGTLTSDSMRMHGVYGVHATATDTPARGDETGGQAGGDETAGTPARRLHLPHGDLEKWATTPEGIEGSTANTKLGEEESYSQGREEERITGTEDAETHNRKLLEQHVKQTIERQSLPFDTTAVMGCCHTLAAVDGRLLGDPIEKAAFSSVGWQLLNPDTAVTTRPWPGVFKEKQQDRLTILRRYPFTSELQRMFVVARHEGPAVPWCGAATAAALKFQQQQKEQQETKGAAAGKKTVDSSDRKSRLLVAGKGSPEIMRGFLAVVPPFYDALCKHFCLKGYRVLTLAAKEYDCREGTAREHDVLQQLKDRKRVEEGLSFAGVLVLTCPIKRHTKETLHIIRAAGHRVVMITGDNPLTACRVARELGVFSSAVLQQHVVLGCSAGHKLASRKQQVVFADTCSNAGEKQHCNEELETELELLERYPAHGTTKTDLQGSSAFRHVLILSAQENVFAAGVRDAATGGAGGTHFACDSTAGGDAAAAGGAAREEDKRRGRYKDTGETPRGSDSIRPGAARSSPSADAQARGRTACFAASFGAVQTSAAEATGKHNYASRAPKIGSLAQLVESPSYSFHWESPEGHVVAKASPLETLLDDVKGPSPVFCSPSSAFVSKGPDAMPGASCFSASVISSGAFPVYATKASGSVSLSFATSIPRNSCGSFSCSSCEQSSLINRSASKASAVGMPRWLAPVLSVEALAQLTASYELCVTGAALDRLFAAAGATTPLHQVRLLQNLVPFVAVYARVSPQQKELVLVSMNACGHITLMCGDGTNDVGALKAAHVGVSLLGNETTEKEGSQNHKYDNFTRKTSSGLKTVSHESGIRVLSRSRKGDRTSVLRSTAAGADGTARASLVKWQSSPVVTSNASCPFNGGERQISVRAQRWQAYLEGALEQAEAADDPPLVQLGDASVASPFTYKGDSIQGVKTILRAGRATLVTVVMMYKLMALNSVVTAFSLSVLTLDGVKLGDLQTTLENLLCTVLTLLISKAQPTIESMSTFRPISSVFHPSVLLSLIGQSAIHCYTLYASWVVTRPERGIDWDPDIDGPFEPNLVNTVVFLLIASMHASTFLSNYEGAPYMKPLRENRPFCVTLGILLCSLIVLVLEIFPSFNAWLSLVPFPSAACKLQIIQLVALDILSAWAVGWSTRKLGCWMASNRSRLPRLLQ